MLYKNQVSKEHLCTAIGNGLPQSIQVKLDQKDKDYRMLVANDNLLNYLYHLEMEDT
jgi:hypothetical protein